MTLTTPLSGKIFFGSVGRAMVSQCTEYEVSRFTRYEAVNGGAKCRKWGGLGWLRSTAMSPFDRAHTTSYSTLIETMCPVSYTHRPTLSLQLHNFEFFRIFCTSSFCTVAWQLARFQLTRRIARSLSDSRASCNTV